MKLAFAGLGRMGRPIALNLMKSGAAFIVSSRRSDVLREFERNGAAVTSDVTELASADIIFLCLPDGQVVHDVVLGANGLLQRLSPGQIVVDLSTIGYAATGAIASALAETGVDFLDAPVSGMEARAVDGTLTVMCGGKRAIFDRVKPYLDRIGTTILFMGATGHGQLAKLINQLLFDINMAALAEVLPMAVKMGLNPDLIGEVINSGTARSYASEFFVPRILAGRFSDGYPMKHAYKDLVSGSEISAEMGIPMPVLAAATITYQMALLRGEGDHDKGGMVRVFEDLLNVRYRGASSVSE